MWSGALLGHDGRVMRLVARVSLVLALAATNACDKKQSSPTGPTPSASAAPSPDVSAGRTLFDARCAACHTIGEGDRTGPDLMNVGKRRDQDWLMKWIENPVAMGDSNHIGKEISAKYGDVIMPNPNLSDAEIEQVLRFIADASSRGGYKVPNVPARKLAGPELDKAQSIYFDRCAGCHGSERRGATGPALTPDRTGGIGTAKLIAALNHGRPGGMPAWGEFGILSTQDVELLAHYLQMPPAARPALGLEEIKKSWNLKVPVGERPKKPAHSRNWQNFFAVVMRQSGLLAVIDGDTKEKLTLLDVGFAAHSVRASRSGRYLYALARDGRITLVDLWSELPSIVAQGRGCFDARSLEVSKTPAQADKLLVEGCYWPPQYVVFDGQTLEPKHAEGAAVIADAGAPPLEVRVGSIRAPLGTPIWALSLIDSGQVALVDYSKPGFPIVARITAAPQILDGGLDPTGRWLILPSAAKNQLAVVDLGEKKLVTSVETGRAPHLDPGARWQNPELGWVMATTHLGEGKLSVFGVDPKDKPENAWKVVREVSGLAAGGISVRTHPKSQWVWLDSPANRSPELARQVCVVKKQDAKLGKCWKPMDRGRVLAFEYNQAGTEVWVLGSDPKGEIIVYDDASLKEVQRISGDWVDTPMAVYNTTNSANDVY